MQIVEELSFLYAWKLEYNPEDQSFYDEKNQERFEEFFSLALLPLIKKQRVAFPSLDL